MAVQGRVDGSDLVFSRRHADHALAVGDLGRLQRDLAVRSPEGMEEWVGSEYASLEVVRRAIADVVVDDEEPALVAVALDRAAQLLSAAA